MFGSGVLDLAIGLTFVYLILSLICTGINEWIASKFNVRGKNLFDGITNLLNDPYLNGLAQLMYGHGLVDGISQDAANPNKTNRLPSYIPSGIFAMALMDVLKAIGNKPDSFPQFRSTPPEAGNSAPSPDATHQSSEVKPKYDRWGRIDTALLDAQKLEMALQEGRDLVKQADTNAAQALDNIRMAVNRLPAGHTKESLFVLIDKTRRDAILLKKETIKAEDYLEQFQRNLEQWYDEAMMRVGGWYKRWTQRILLLLGFVLVFAVNADSIMLMKSLSRNDALRGALVAAADEVARPSPVSPSPQPQPGRQSPASLNADPRYSQVLKKAATLDLPLGWSRSEDDPLKIYHVPHLADVGGSWPHFLGLCLMKLVGLLISAVAVSLGAPFWFDTLSKIVNLRGAGTPPGGAKKSEPKSTEKTP